MIGRGFSFRRRTPWRSRARSTRCSHARTSGQISVRRGGSTRWRPSLPNQWRGASLAFIASRLQRPRRSALIAVQIAFAAAVAWFAGRAIRDQWARVVQAQLSLDPSWAWVILSAAIVLATYLLLVQVWILHLRDWG